MFQLLAPTVFKTILGLDEGNREDFDKTNNKGHLKLGMLKNERTISKTLKTAIKIEAEIFRKYSSLKNKKIYRNLKKI